MPPLSMPRPALRLPLGPLRPSDAPNHADPAANGTSMEPQRKPSSRASRAGTGQASTSETAARSSSLGTIRGSQQSPIADAPRSGSAAAAPKPGETAPAPPDALRATANADPTRARPEAGYVVRVHGESASATVILPHPEQRDLLQVRWNTSMRQTSTISLADVTSMVPQLPKRRRVSTAANRADPTANDRTAPTVDNRSAPTNTSQADHTTDASASPTADDTTAPATDGQVDPTARGRRDPAAGDHANPTTEGPTKPAIDPSHSQPPRRHNDETGPECRVLSILTALAPIARHFDTPAPNPMTYSHLHRHTRLIADALSQVSSFSASTTATPIAYAAMARHGRLPDSEWEGRTWADLRALRPDARPLLISLFEDDHPIEDIASALPFPVDEIAARMCLHYSPCPTDTPAPVPRALPRKRAGAAITAGTTAPADGRARATGGAPAPPPPGRRMALTPQHV